MPRTGGTETGFSGENIKVGLLRAPLAELLVKGRIGKIDILLVHLLFGQADCFAEAYKRKGRGQILHSIWTLSLVA